MTISPLSNANTIGQLVHTANLLINAVNSLNANNDLASNTYVNTQVQALVGNTASNTYVISEIQSLVGNTASNTFVTTQLNGLIANTASNTYVNQLLANTNQYIASVQEEATSLAVAMAIALG